MKRALIIVCALVLTGFIAGLGTLYFSPFLSRGTPASHETVTTEPSKYDNINVQLVGRHENDDRSLLSVAYPVTENGC